MARPRWRLWPRVMNYDGWDGALSVSLGRCCRRCGSPLLLSERPSFAGGGLLNYVSWRLAKIDHHPAMILPASSRCGGYLADAMVMCAQPAPSMRRWPAAVRLENLFFLFAVQRQERHGHAARGRSRVVDGGGVDWRRYVSVSGEPRPLAQFDQVRHRLSVPALSQLALLL